MKLLRLLQALLLSCSLLAASSALADEAGDIVFLKGGGRVRGLVVEESPTAGVRVKLADGTIKVVLAKDVDHVEYASAKPAEPPPPEPKPEPKPEPPALLAPLHVESEEPGIVSIDGAEVGPAPIDMKDIEPGKHRIRITYDRGGKSEKVVFVRDGERNEVRFQKSSATKAGEAREGVHLAFSGEPFFGYMPRAFVGSVGGLRLFGGINLGLAPAVDLRVGGQIGFWGNSGIGFLPIQGRATFRFNLGPLYSMEVGGHAGVTFLPTAEGRPVALAGGGPDFSFLSFRFGDVRQFEITAMESFDFLTLPGDDPGNYLWSFQQSVGFAWVLPD